MTCWQFPQPHTSSNQASNPVTSDDGRYVYQAHYTAGPGNDIQVMRWDRDTQAYDEQTVVTITGAAKTLCSLPVTDDSHNWINIFLTKNIDGSVRRVYLAANMHNGGGAGEGDPKVIRTQATDGSITGTWESGVADFPDMGADFWTYPISAQFENGETILMMRNGISGNGNWYLWRHLGDGTDNWVKTFLYWGIDCPSDADPEVLVDMNFYPLARPYVMHDADETTMVAGCWRTSIGDDFANETFMYMVSHDRMRTFRTIDGTNIPFPIHKRQALTIPNLDTGLIPMDGEPGLLNLGGVCSDPIGEPVIVSSLNPMYMSRWDGDSWVNTQMGTTVSGLTLDGKRLNSITPIWMNDSLHYLTVSFIQTSTWLRHPTAFRIPDIDNPDIADEHFFLGVRCADGNRSGFAGSLWDMTYDAVARRLGYLRVYTPQGNIPRMVEWRTGIQEGV